MKEKLTLTLHLKYFFLNAINLLQNIVNKMCNNLRNKQIALKS